MKKAVCDTSTLIRLYKGKALHCLSELFDKIYIPDAVKNECRDKTIREAISTPPFEIRQVETVLPIGLGLGEREAISLAVETGTKIFCTDDGKAFNKAMTHNLTPMRSFRILTLGKEAGLIDSVGTVLHRMEKAGEGIDPDRYFESLKIAGEI